jgi:hypothetical protein
VGRRKELVKKWQRVAALRPDCAIRAAMTCL